MLNSVNEIFHTFGASVVVPIIIFVIALLLRVKPRTAMMSAFYAGVGLTGFTWIISEFTPVITKVVRQMVNNTGIKLPVVDIGWEAGSLAAFGSTVGLTFFVFGLVRNFNNSLSVNNSFFWTITMIIFDNQIIFSFHNLKFLIYIIYPINI